MAARFWVGGTATWDNSTTTHWASTSGGGGGASVPVAADDVTFDSNSGASATITTNYAISVKSITINLAGLSLVLGAGSTVAGAVTLTGGTLNTASFACTWGSFTSTSGGPVRTLTLGTSAVTITAVSAGTIITTQANFTMTGGSSIWTFTAAAPSVNYQPFTNVTYPSMIFNGGGNVNFNGGGTITLPNLTLTGTASTACLMALTPNLTITGTFTVTGNSAVNRYAVVGNLFAVKTITAAVVALSYVNFRDITGAGAGWATATTTGGVGNLANCSGITFDVAANQYRVGAGGTWGDVTHWASTDGGSGSTGRIPLPQDTAIIDANASGTITCNMAWISGFDFTGFTGTFSTATTAPSVCGNATFGTGMSTAAASALTFNGRGSQTITSNGVTITMALIFNAVGGTYTLVGNLVCSQGVTVNHGTLDAATNNVNVTCLTFGSGPTSPLTSTINMGTGTWTLTSTAAGSIWNISAPGQVTVNASTSTVVISGASANSRTFTGGGKTYGTLTYTVSGSTGALVLDLANNTFNTINFWDGSNARTLTLPSSFTTTVTNWNVSGFPSNLITVNATTPGTQATLSGLGTYYSSDYLYLQDVAVV
jgi:hypothetical protein